MADFALGGGARGVAEGFTVGASGGATVTASSTIDTVGSYVELVSAANNTFNTNWIEIHNKGNAANADFLCNIALGGAGSEQDIIENIWTFTGVFQQGSCLRIPCKIPAGERISVNCQSGTSSAALELYIVRGLSGFSSHVGAGGLITIGADTANTKGVTVARSTAGTWGSWVEMTSSLANNIKGFAVAAHRDTVTSWTTGDLLYQVGVGSAGNEEILTTEQVTISGSEIMQNAIADYKPISISKGERIAIRASADATNTDFDLDYVLYGVR